MRQTRRYELIKIKGRCVGHLVQLRDSLPMPTKNSLSHAQMTPWEDQGEGEEISKLKETKHPYETIKAKHCVFFVLL